MRDSPTRFKSREFAFMGGVALSTHSRGKSAELEEGVLTATEKNPGQFTLPGFYRLLPQLVGSCDPGGEVGGWGPPGLAC
jgi:hypothetical protein